MGKVPNPGVLRGDVFLGAGDDLFDSRTGSLKDTVDGFDGDDRVRRGLGAETVHRGALASTRSTSA